MDHPDSLASRHLASFPKKHLILASALATVAGTALLLLPSTEVKAERNSIPLALDFATDSTDSNQNPTTPSPVSLLQPASPAPVVQPAAQQTKTPAPVAAVVVEETPQWHSVQIKSGSTLSTIFRKQGLSPSLLHALVTSSKEGKLLNRVSPGQHIEFLKNSEGELTKVRYVRNRLESVLFSRTEKSFSAEEIIYTPNARQAFAEAEINHSLFLAAQSAGMSETVTMKLANIFGWDIDFALDIRKGDSFRVIYEENFLDGEKISDGDIVAAQFTNQGRVYTAVRYTDSKGHSDYYSPDGRSMRKAFLRSPVDFARISSRFNLKRKHPVLNKIRAHKGVDYAASTGTPIRAAGDGKVIHAARKGGFGKAVIIQHGQRYSTLYAHMSKYGRGIRSGKHVKQGQIIGYVGSTGLATGPHLHYEFRENGVHVNPMTVKLPSAKPIPKKERASFENRMQLLISRLEHPTAILALND
ncbi:peptidoglycan DD-metalloendopeptidase family protein [Aestuariirhabdus sp. Z084]|uniref:OapA family protein n=1 Tax=Aestuariirhabdus haliotis TaxID=2918751 RepID=UPI00201B3741|nr:peptidoglycan DD-metalloendopeptidase family protein [Aestuariirhabdus haliotis]MCL6415322.1 peptidoglycan DD-metalloendopeptidase family protein [Aestuariirhabdus haliotis]MCL6419078.1 peptidoglycan DD-metalloendopeptidase family protein [Aestuariirhabdus haliotis]